MATDDPRLWYAHYEPKDSNIAWYHNPTTYCHPPSDNTYTLNIDCSRWQGEIDWDSVLKGVYPNPIDNQGKEDEKMQVYDVVVVDKTGDAIVFAERVVAKSAEQAKLLIFARMIQASKASPEDVADFHFAISKIGEPYCKE